MSGDSGQTRRRGILRRFWEKWKRIASKIGNFQGRVVLFAFYFLVLGPVGLAVRWLADPLSIKVRSTRGWRSRGSEPGTPLDRAGKQF